MASFYTIAANSKFAGLNILQAIVIGKLISLKIYCFLFLESFYIVKQSRNVFMSVSIFADNIYFNSICSYLLLTFLRRITEKQ